MTSKNNSKKIISKKERENTLLIEVAWEVMNQQGGIYTVIKSKLLETCTKWGDNYCLLGPYFQNQVNAEFDPIINPKDAIGKVVEMMRSNSIDIHYGKWLVPGNPKVVLFNIESVWNKLSEIKYLYWEHHKVEFPDTDDINKIIAFKECVKIFLKELCFVNESRKNIIAHFHEWQGGACIPDLRREKVPLKTVFTTHATILGRYLAMNSPNFYQHLPFIDWQKEKRFFNISAIVDLERSIAHGAHIFTTVSRITDLECEHLLGRKADLILPNGINNQRFEALHEFQNLHLEYKNKIHKFVISHFFKNSAFDLNKTLYFFTSGRFEFRNKGFDIALEALARLNWKLKSEKSQTTVVMFFITKRDFYSINSEILHSMAVLDEIQQTTETIKKQIGEQLFQHIVTKKDNQLPILNDFINKDTLLLYRRLIQSWKTNALPPVVTHNLKNDGDDEILNYLRASHLVNNIEDRVKIVYHPDFISPINTLFGMDYGQFVRGTHLGIFPSYYEPWGYTPLECIASGVPTVTSDLAGFGDYVLYNLPDHFQNGITVINRKTIDFNKSAEQLCAFLYNFTKMERRERITLRNRVENISVHFHWEKLLRYYDEAYKAGLSTAF